MTGLDIQLPQWEENQDQFLLTRGGWHLQQQKDSQAGQITMICCPQEPYGAQDDVSSLHLLLGATSTSFCPG